MTQNKRIIVNILATYGRTVFGAACGIFSTRWVLMALGQEDFGLFGLIGSIVLFLTFFNIQLAGALSRFYAYAVGAARVASDGQAGLEECRKWFTTGVLIHTVVPMLLVSIGYPIGSWAIRTGLVGVPTSRIGECIWLWRFVCASSFVTMMGVPFSAMYTAKQYIAELTIYSFSQTFVRTAFIFYMSLHPGDWLVKYGFAMCLIVIIPQLLICTRAVAVFPECHLIWKDTRFPSYVKKLGAYAWWQTIGGLGFLARHQFLTIVVNRFLGPKITASFSIGGTVGGEAAALTGALQGAFAPAITTACGEGNWERVRAMSYRACKFGTLLTLAFAIPMALEVSVLLRAWLKEVPCHAEGVCLIMLAVMVVEKLSLGHNIGVNASGRVARFQVCRGLACMTAIPFSIVSILVWRHVYAVCLALFLTTCIACCSDVWLARTRIGLSVRYWLVRILMPLGIMTSLVICVGIVPRYLMEPTFLRLVITAAISILTLAGISWGIVLDTEERCFVRDRLDGFFQKIWRVK